MSGSFLDTTVVVELAEDGAAATWARAFLSQNQPAQVPYYALRELLTGRVRILCDTHNKLHAAENLGEAMLAISSLPSVAGRTKQGAFQTLALAMSKVFDSNPHGDRDDLKRELLQDIASSTTRLWNKARRASGMSTVQALACFSVGKLSRGVAGELRGHLTPLTVPDRNAAQQQRICMTISPRFRNSSKLYTLISWMTSQQRSAKTSNDVKRSNILKAWGRTCFIRGNAGHWVMHTSHQCAQLA